MIDNIEWTSTISQSSSLDTPVSFNAQLSSNLLSSFDNHTLTSTSGTVWQGKKHFSFLKMNFNFHIIWAFLSFKIEYLIWFDSCLVRVIIEQVWKILD